MLSRVLIQFDIPAVNHYSNMRLQKVTVKNGLLQPWILVAQPVENLADGSTSAYDLMSAGIVTQIAE